MPLPANGWTTDELIGGVLMERGLLPTIFEQTVRAVVKQKLANLEIAGTLSAAERVLQNNMIAGGDITRVIEFIKLDASGKWAARGYWSGSGDLTTMVNTAWANILKYYS